MTSDSATTRTATATSATTKRCLQWTWQQLTVPYNNNKFRLILVRWIGLFAFVVVANLALVLQGGKLSELATAVIIGFAVLYHYVFEPLWIIPRRLWCCGKPANDNNNDNNDITSMSLETEKETITAVILSSSSSDDEEESLESGTQEPTESDASSSSLRDVKDPMVQSHAVINNTEMEPQSNPTNDTAVTHDVTTTASPASTSRGTQRLLFLDNVKIFLTVLVVTHHTTQGFGADRADSFYLVVGLNDPSSAMVRSLLRGFCTLNQAYFMPLFFFVSAYFVPSSLAKYGPDQFVAGKRHRLVYPAMITWVTIMPACMMIQQVVRQSYEEMIFVFNPGHTWFLVWLLLLCWMYASFHRAFQTGHDCNDGTTNTHPTSTKASPSSSLLRFPSTLTRFIWSIGICGILQWVIVLMFAGTFLVAMMPLQFGSMSCDMFMFAMGILAKQNNWLAITTKSTAAGRLIQRPWWFRLMVLLEGATLVVLVRVYQWWESTTTTIAEEDRYYGIGVPALSPFGFVFYVVAGLFCVDMGLALIQLFQEYGNNQTKWTQFCSKAAYTVYLIHPLVVVLAQTGYIYAYNAYKVANGQQDQVVFFEQFDPDDPTTRAGQGGGPYFALVGWILVNVISHVIVWPLGWMLSNAPFLRTML